MDMESLLNTVMNNLNLSPQGEQTLKATLSLNDFLEQGVTLKNGQSLSLSLNDNLLNVTDSEGKTVSLPPQSLKIEHQALQNARPQTIEAKVLGQQNGEVKLQLTSLDNMPPKQFVQARQNQAASQPTMSSTQPLIIRSSSDVSQITLPKVSVTQVVEPYIARQPLPANLQTALQSALARVEVQTEVKSLPNLPQSPTTTPVTATAQSQPTAATVTLQAKVAEVVSQTAARLPTALPSETANIIETAVQQLRTSLAELVGQTLTAQSVQTPQNKTVFTGLLGEIAPEQPLQLPENLVVELQITDVGVRSRQTTVSPLDKILQTVQSLKTEQPRLYQQLLTKLPSADDNMLQNMALFHKAAVKGDVSHWLGETLTRELENSGAQGKAVLEDLQTAVQNSNRQTPSWRVVEIPYYYENRLDKIRLAVKQYPEDEDDTPEKRQKFGTRFVVDTDFSRLGQFQFDGFSFAKDRRFDLIIRTQKDVGDDLCANIMRIFKTTLSNVGYSGNIKINLKENFIKISEDNKQHKLTSQDLYI